jgi:hypothetical protein
MAKSPMLSTPTKTNAICSNKSNAEATKNGIRILTMNGCTTIDEVVMISCQYNMNSIKDDKWNGNDK